MKLIVDENQRFAKMRAHTAAHLLHAELVKIFPNTKQAWSFVDQDYLRFDFVADKALTNEELLTIQKNINQIIYDGSAVSMTEMSYKDAIASWAKAFFEDKYWDTVRVVEIKGIEWKNISTELCGGTHAGNTRDIWCFVILGQEAVASGVKRISAVTGPKVYEQIQERDNLLDNIASKLWVNSKQVVDKIEKFVKDYEVLKTSFESLQTKFVSDIIWKLENKNKNIDNLDRVLEIPSDIDFKIALLQAKSLFVDQNVLIYNKSWNFALFTNKDSAKELANKIGLKWGWNDQMVQGRDEKIVGLV